MEPSPISPTVTSQVATGRTMNLLDTANMRLSEEARLLSWRASSFMGPFSLPLSPVALLARPGAGWDGQPVSSPVSPSRWRDLLVEAVEWLGPLPVRWDLGAAPPLELAGLARFSARLGCRTRVAMEPSHEAATDQAVVEALVVAGARSLDIVVPSMAGGRSAVTELLTCLLNAREEAGTMPDITLALLDTLDVLAAREALEGWARQAGVDEVRVVPASGGPTSGPRPALTMVMTADGAVGSRAGRQPFGYLAAPGELPRAWRAGMRHLRDSKRPPAGDGHQPGGAPLSWHPSDACIERNP